MASQRLLARSGVLWRYATTSRAAATTNRVSLLRASSTLVAATNGLPLATPATTTSQPSHSSSRHDLFLSKRFLSTQPDGDVMDLLSNAEESVAAKHAAEEDRKHHEAAQAAAFSVFDNTDNDLPKFEDIPHLSQKSKKAIRSMGIENMTEIQAKTYDAAIQGKDVLGRARTGTGKTLAFLLPSVERILRQQEKQQQLGNNKPRKNQDIGILILSPTRELAMQIGEQARLLCGMHGPKNLTHQVMVGGSSRMEDIRNLQRQVPQILVATPGRLLDHLDSTYLKQRDGSSSSFASLLKNMQVLVLDETDRLLDMGFRQAVEDIMTFVPRQRQTLLFSATVPPEVRGVIDQTLKPGYATVDCIHEEDPSSHVNSQVSQSHVILPTSTRLISGTVELLLKLMEEDEKNKLIVFFPTTNLVRFYSDLFNFGLGKQVIEIHSKKSQSYRTSASNRFREVNKGVMFTSDVSARGVDYPDVSHVVQFGMAETRETYIHRLGRTGRAGKKGQGLLILSDLEEGFLKTLHGLDIPANSDLQYLVDSPKSSHVVDQLEPIMTSIRDETNPSLAKSVEDAYMSMLGFYGSRLRQVGIHDRDSLVHLANSFSLQAGMVEPPALRPKTARNMGLANVPGLRIGDTPRRRAPFERKDGFRGGGGRGGGRYGPRGGDRFGGNGGGGRGSGGGSYRGGGGNRGGRGGGYRGRRPSRGRDGYKGGGSMSGTGSYDDWGRDD